ncbi:MAG: hypothetical protein M1480_17740 [Bacteroidetes bacterium]|nr:hypothetical protein [Bacteroidota bacterium]
MKNGYKKIVLSIIALLAAGVGPNLFVISQAGYSDLSDLAVNFLIPSIAVLIIVFALSYFLGLQDFNRQIRNGFLAGLIGTIGLEIVRETGFHLGGMPGDLPKLMGVLLMNQFASGPDTISNIAGWSYHFWNGAAFGIIYSIILGKGRKWTGALYGILIGIGFMMSPVVVSLGVGHFGVDFGWGFPVTVTIAHIAFGTIVGWLVFKWNDIDSGFIITLKQLFNSK